eukprot:4968252-Amphidinium_carterae.1
MRRAKDVCNTKILTIHKNLSLYIGECWEGSQVISSVADKQYEAAATRNQRALYQQQALQAAAQTRQQALQAAAQNRQQAL